jgi:Mce-associated membrane protein
MAKHADATDGPLKLNGSSPKNEQSPRVEEKHDDAEADADDGQETDERENDSAETGVQERRSRVRLAIAVGVAVVAALGCAAGSFGYRTYEDRKTQAQRNELAEAARQGAVNLTTIDYTHVEADIQRILDSSTGAFLDDFKKRSQPFVDVVKHAQSKTQGTVTEAGLESQNGDQAQVLVAVSVKTSNAGAPEQQPRAWRMRINVQQVGDAIKVSDVQFVP